jgi:hypothetical protein
MGVLFLSDSKLHLPWHLRAEGGDLVVWVAPYRPLGNPKFLCRRSVFPDSYRELLPQQGDGWDVVKADPWARFPSYPHCLLTGGPQMDCHFSSLRISFSALCGWAFLSWDTGQPDSTTCFLCDLRWFTEPLWTLNLSSLKEAMVVLKWRWCSVVTMWQPLWLLPVEEAWRVWLIATVSYAYRMFMATRCSPKPTSLNP